MKTGRMAGCIKVMQQPVVAGQGDCASPDQQIPDQVNKAGVRHSGRGDVPPRPCAGGRGKLSGSAGRLAPKSCRSGKDAGGYGHSVFSGGFLYGFATFLNVFSQALNGAAAGGDSQQGNGKDQEESGNDSVHCCAVHLYWQRLEKSYPIPDLLYRLSVNVP